MFNPKWIVGKTVRAVDMRPFQSNRDLSAARCRNPEGRRLGHTKKRPSLYPPAMSQRSKGDCPMTGFHYRLNNAYVKELFGLITLA